jgi:hypothetical protein
MLSVEEKEERVRAQKEREGREWKAREEGGREAGKAAVSQQNPNDTHELRLDILEEELKKEKEKTKQLRETLAPGDVNNRLPVDRQTATSDSQQSIYLSASLESWHKGFDGELLLSCWTEIF